VKQTALITGASGGIGLELARIFAREGFDLILIARREEALRELADALLTKYGTRSLVLAADLADPGSPGRLAAEIASRGGQLDALVNNAGFGTSGPFRASDLDAQLAMIRVNISALTELTHRFLPGMIASRRGLILNVASTAAFQAGPLMAVYYATKAYVLHFSEAIANELAGSGVSVTALCPGPTLTGFQAAAGIERTRLLGRMSVADAASVAEAGYRGLLRGKRVVVPGLVNRLAAEATRLVPRRMAAAVARHMQEKR
jgi:short-subunit dehydrogenase